MKRNLTLTSRSVRGNRPISFDDRLKEITMFFSREHAATLLVKRLRGRQMYDPLILAITLGCLVLFALVATLMR